MYIYIIFFCLGKLWVFLFFGRGGNGWIVGFGWKEWNSNMVYRGGRHGKWWRGSNYLAKGEGENIDLGKYRWMHYLGQHWETYTYLPTSTSFYKLHQQKTLYNHHQLQKGNVGTQTNATGFKLARMVVRDGWTNNYLDVMSCYPEGYNSFTPQR